MQLVHGSASSWNALCYPESHPNTTRFLANQLESVSDMLTGAGRSFMERSRAAFEHYNGAAAMRFAREAVRAVQGVFETPGIRQLSTLDEMTRANDIMQRWMMANPVVRERYHAQRMDGYSDTYSDVHGAVSGEEHYDYRRVMDGIVQWDTNGDWSVTQYVEPLLEGDRDLLFEEQLDIMNGWSAMDLLLSIGKDDPTSNSGGSL